MLKNSRGLQYTIALLSVAVIGIVAWMRLNHLSGYARSWDQVDFALGVENFDMFLMRPHFPGYPYFILGGTLFHRWFDNPSIALAAFNVILITSAAVPMYLLFRRRLSTACSLLGATVIQSLAYLSAMTTEPMSDPAAGGILWWFLWSLVKAGESEPGRTPWWIRLLPALLFGLLLGIRLSYIPFGLGLLLLWYRKRKQFNHKQRYRRYLIEQAVWTVIFQSVWIVGLIVSVGGTRFFVSMAVGFVEGHFTDWGETVATDHSTIGERLARLFFHNLLWVGLAGKSRLAAFMGVIFVLVALAVRPGQKLKQGDQVPLGKWTLALIGIYFAWVFIGQNIDKPRHILPLIGLISFVVFMRMMESRMRKYVLAFILVFVGIQVVEGYHYMAGRAQELPATYQLAGKLDQLDKPLIVYTWEEERMLDYLHVDYPYKKIYTYEYFLADLNYAGKRTVYLTDHVLQGFKEQGFDFRNKVEKVAVFRSDPIFDPVYSEITLYKWIDHR